MALPNARPWAPDATLVLDLARDEAAGRDHRWIGTAHLLRAVVRADGPQAGLLAAAGVTDRGSDVALTLAVWTAAGEPDPSGPPGPPTANEAVHEVLADAVEHAAQEGHDTVGASDLLAALLDRPTGQAADMLVTLGADAERLADALAGLEALTAPNAPEVVVRPSPTRRLVPRDPGGLLSSAWRDVARSA